MVTTDGVGNDDPKPVRNQHLAYVFMPSRDHFPAKPYYEDGDPSMYSENNMIGRDDLKDSPMVRQAIMDFIKNQFILTGTQVKLCNKDEYCKVFMKVG